MVSTMVTNLPSLWTWLPSSLIYYHHYHRQIVSIDYITSTFDLLSVLFCHVHEIFLATSAAESISVSPTIFTYSVLKATEFGEITQRLALLRRSRSSKVTEFDTNRKHICDFLLVVNSNLPPILHHFRDIVLQRSKISISGFPSSV